MDEYESVAVRNSKAAPPTPSGRIALATELGEAGKIDPQQARQLLKVPEAPAREIARMKMMAAVNFNRTENNTLDCSRDKCLLVEVEHGVEAVGEKYNETVLIPWVNIAYIRYT